MRIGDLLVNVGIITLQQLNEALENKGSDERLGDYLIRKEIITERQMMEILEFQLGVPHVQLNQFPIDPDVMHLVPKQVAYDLEVLPLGIRQKKLLVAMVDPMDYFAIEELRLLTGKQIEPRIAMKSELLQMINRYYEMRESMEGALKSIEDSEDFEEKVEEDEDAPIIRLVHQLFTEAVLKKASDIHIDSTEHDVKVRYRVDGLLYTERIFPKKMSSALIARIKIMAKLNITENRVPQDGRIKIKIQGRPIDFRVSILPTLYGEKVVMRILDMSDSLTSIERLGMSEKNLDIFKKMVTSPTGIVLVTGPTGSGKSSTLHAALHTLNTEKVNLITVEDPIEYQIDGVNQIQVNEDVGLTFAKGLRSILRQDPDIIMVGEIRDEETAEIAVRASLTGHLVLSTLHTNSALETLNRLEDMGIEPYLIASSLKGVVAQRLIRRICKDCGEIVNPDEQTVEALKKYNLPTEYVKKGKGCSICNKTGYKGRLAIHELLYISEEVKEELEGRKNFQNIKRLNRKNGLVSLYEDGLKKVSEGKTTLEEVLRVTRLEE